MENKELKELFEYINKVIRQIRALREEDFEIGIVDSITSDCDNLFDSYEKLLDYINEDLNYKIEREIYTENWNCTQLEDTYADITYWKIPNNLEIDKEDKTLLKLLINNFARNLENILNDLR